MCKRKDITSYLNNFRIQLGRYLKSGVGIQSTIYQFPDGAIIRVRLGLDLQTKDEYRSEANSLTEAMEKSQLFESNLLNDDFKGTRVVLTKESIIIVKSGTEYFTLYACKQDIQEIINSLSKAKEE